MIPMLAKTYGPRFNTFPCYLQPKLNGIRALYQNGTFQSRDEKIWAPKVLAHLIDELKAVDPSIVLDGELYVHGWKLQRINGAVATNRSEPRDDTHLVEYHVFDVVDPKKTFSDRWLGLYVAQQANSKIHFVSTAKVFFREEVDQHFHQITAAGYEGVMLRPDGPYEFGQRFSERVGHRTQYRSPYLFKYKQWEDAEFVCVGVTKGEGKADIGIGALVLVPPDPYKATEQLPRFKVGTGFDDDERVAFARNPPIGKLVRVRYLTLTDFGIPFNPSFLAVLE